MGGVMQEVAEHCFLSHRFSFCDKWDLICIAHL